MPDELPIPFGHPVSNGEFDPLPPADHVREAVRRNEQLADDTARRLHIGRRDFLRSACGGAAALLLLGACRDETGEGPAGGRYDVPDEAITDLDAARAALGGEEFVFDVQTHFLDYELMEERGAVFFGGIFPQAQCGADDERLCFSLDVYLQELFLNSDTNLAVVSAIPIPGDANPLSIEAMEKARRAAEALCDDERVLLHGQALPSTGPLTASLDGMDALAAEHPVKAWKVYTHAGGPAWWLDDHEPGAPQVGDAFLERAEELGITTVCVHKGFSNVGANPGAARFADPVDVGPAAAAHPDIDFVVYHSGFELGNVEGPYDSEDPQGIDRLVRSLEDAGIEPGSNVYAELGGTWYFAMQDPDQAAHVLGKLLVAVGPERVVWGTDSIWFGSPQDQIRALRAFEITEELQDRYGYPVLTPETKENILGLNSAVLYGVDPVTTRCDFTREELEEIRVALPPTPATYGPETAAEARALATAHGWIGF